MKTSSTPVSKCLFLLVCFVVLRPISIFSQEWTQQHPDVDLNQLMDIDIGQDNYGWAVGHKTILKTTDGGASWQKWDNLPNPYYTYEVIEYVEATNGQRFYLGAYNALFETKDGGNTWATVNFGGTQAKVIHIASGHTVIYTENALFHSGDDGVSWTTVLQPTQKILSMTFSTDSFGAASTQNGEIYYTYDGGASWTLSPVTPGVDAPVLAFATQQIGFANIKKDVFKTTDGGQSWALISDETVHPFYVFEAVSETELLATRGNAIFHSTDAGVTWTQGINLHYARNVSGIHSLPNGKAWIAGAYGSIFHFDGTTWQDLLYANKNSLANIVFYNDQVGVAVGADRTILKTLDGGLNWLDISDKKEEFASFYDVYFFSENEFMLTGKDGLLKTTDGGQNWTTQVFPSTSELLDFSAPPGSNKIFVSGTSGAVFVSDDHGQNWTDISTSENDRYNNLAFPSNSVGYAASAYGGMMKTIDGGANWTSTFLSSTQGFAGLSFINESEGYVLGSGYTDVLKHTTDGGSSWSTIHLPVKSYWRNVLFLDNQNGWVIGGTSTNGVCYQTTDGGNSWDLIYQAPFGLAKMALINDGTTDHIWVCGAAGIIAKNNTVVSTAPTISKDLSLYPNPLTTNSLYIQGLASSATYIEIGIFTLAGKRLFTKSRHPAQEPITLNGLQTGTYLVRIINRDSGKVYVDKLVVLQW